jgi:SAM-dependent methyltransferase
MRKAANILKSFLEHPLTRGMDIDDPRVTRLRSQILESNPFLFQLYSDWYRQIAAALPQDVAGPILELGTGAGFLATYIPGLITSDLTPGINVHLLLDGQRLPFGDGSLRAIVMINVLHHIPDAEAFFHEVIRCLQVGGRLLMNEPWVTPWSRLVYKNLHHEPFDPEATTWRMARTGPLSGANGALPWIILQRDRSRFESKFPTLSILRIELHTPFRYIVSGGLSMRPLMPGWSFRYWYRLELALNRWMDELANFALITLVHRF